MRVNFDSYNGIIRSVKIGDWSYSFKKAGSFDGDRDKIKGCISSVPEKFKDDCDFLVIQESGNGYKCWLASKPCKSGHNLNKKRGYEFGTSWKKLHMMMKEKHNIVIPSDRQIENLEDFASRVNGNGIDLRKYEEFMELERY